MSKKKSKAVEETETLLQNLISNEVAKAESLLKRKQKENEEKLHNAIVEKIQEVNLPPASVIFVLEMLKSEILNQFLRKEGD